MELAVEYMKDMQNARLPQIKLQGNTERRFSRLWYGRHSPEKQLYPRRTPLTPTPQNLSIYYIASLGKFH